MLSDAKFDTRFWAEAVVTAVYLKNRSPTRTIKNMTPEEAWSGVMVDILSHLRIFGSKAQVHVSKELRKKFDPKSQTTKMMGYSEGMKAVIRPRKNKIITARNVVFIENDKTNLNETVTGQESDCRQSSSEVSVNIQTPTSSDPKGNCC